MSDYSVAFGLAREAAVEAEPLSAILPRVMVTILSTVPSDLCGMSRLEAIRRGVADASEVRTGVDPAWDVTPRELDEIP